MVTAVCAPSDLPAASVERAFARLGEAAEALAADPEPRRGRRRRGAAALRRRDRRGPFRARLLPRSEAGRTLTGPVGRRLCPAAGVRWPWRRRAIAAAPPTQRGGDRLRGRGRGGERRPGRRPPRPVAGCRRKLLCVVPPLPPWALDAGVDAGYSRGDVEHHHLSSFGHYSRGRWRSCPPGWSAEGRLLEGRPAAVILRELKRGLDLLVMASPGVRPVAGVRPGTTAIRSCAPAPAPSYSPPPASGRWASGTPRPRHKRPQARTAARPEALTTPTGRSVPGWTAMRWDVRRSAMDRAASASGASESIVMGSVAISSMRSRPFGLSTGHVERVDHSERLGVTAGRRVGQDQAVDPVSGHHSRRVCWGRARAAGHQAHAHGVVDPRVGEGWAVVSGMGGASRAHGPTVCPSRGPSHPRPTARGTGKLRTVGSRRGGRDPARRSRPRPSRPPRPASTKRRPDARLRTAPRPGGPPCAPS